MASGTEFGSVWLWDVATGQQRGLLEKESPANERWPVVLLAFSPDGRTLLAGKADQSIKLWDVETGKEFGDAPLKKGLAPPRPIQNPNQDPIIPVMYPPPAISPNFKTLAVGTSKGIELRDVAAGTQIGILQTAKNTSDHKFAFDQTGSLLGVVHDTSVDVWDVGTRKVLCTYRSNMRENRDSMASMAFSPDGALAASGDANSSVEILEAGGGMIHHEKPLPNSIRLWNSRTGKEVAVLKGHMGPIKALVFAPDGKTLISASDDQTIRFWDIAGKREKVVLSDHNAPVACLSLSLDGKSLVSGSSDQTAKLWDVASARETRTLLWTVAADQDTALSTFSGAGPAFTPDGKTVFYGTTTGMIREVDVSTGKVTASLAGHADIIDSMSLSRDGKTLASGGFDFLVRIWDVPSGKTIGVVRAPEEGLFSRGQEMHCLLSPDGRIVGDGRLWWGTALSYGGHAMGRALDEAADCAAKQQ